MADKKEEDYYSILGCERDASMETIRQQYKKLALQLHPDKNSGDGLGDKTCDDFNLLNKAASTLTDEKEKHKYDTLLLEKRSPKKIVNDEINIDDFEFDEENQCYFYNCRCGGHFVLSVPEFVMANSSLVDCNTCSLSIRTV